ncbi:MAG TPA: hypothetical protein VGK48_28515 [Terriglobia bacterium]|jgi:hypothetical protein
MSTSRKEPVPPEVRVVVEVDGNPVGFLNLDVERLWPLINHRKHQSVPIEWMDIAKLDSLMRASIVRRLVARMQNHLYQTVGNEIVKAELDVENFKLKAEAAAQAFGTKKTDIEKLVAESGRTASDFDSFFWEYVLDDKEVNDLKKEWKVKGTPPR